MKKRKSKLANHRGETIGEVLVALLIASLGLTLLAGMIHSSAIVTRKSQDAIAEYETKLVNTVIPQDSTGSTGSVTFSLADKLTDEGNSNSVTYFSAEFGSGSRTVKSYK